MADLSQGAHANLILEPGDVFRVSTSGVATVLSIYGAPAGTTTLTARSQDFGPFSVPAKLRVDAIDGAATYTKYLDSAPHIVRSPGQNPIGFRDQLTGQTFGFSLDASRLNGGRYITCLPMSSATQSRGFASDISGAGNHGLLFGVAPATAWANAGYFTTDPTSNGNGYLFIEGWRDYWRSLSQDEANRKTIIVSMVIKADLPASSLVSGFGCTAAGPFWSLRGTGAAFPGSIQTSFKGVGAAVGGVLNSAVYLDGADHTFTMALDLASRRYYQYLDGVLVCVGATNVSSQPNSPIQEPMNPAVMTEFGIGLNNPALSGSQTATAMQVRGVHLIVLDRMPSNMNDIAQRLHRVPDVALAYNDVVMASKHIVLADAGHSNSQGFGSTDRSMSSAGEPLFDPVWPNGSTEGRFSMHTGITERLAAQGIYAHILNTSVGTSSIVDHWCGSLRTWVSNMSAGLGSYVIASGGVWKITTKPTGASGTATARITLSFTVGTTAPSGTSDVAATSTTPGYTYLGPVTAADAPGTVYAYGDARFDPNGFVANLVAAVNATNPAVYERWVRLNFGNTDTGKGSTFEMYRAAHVNLARALNQALGAKVLIGMANRGDGNNAPATAEYDNTFIPARLAAVSDLAGTGWAFPGADLVATLGQLPNATYSPTQRPTDNLPALLNESSVWVHINDKATRIAAAAWSEVIANVAGNK